jgi:hypothetical protein
VLQFAMLLNKKSERIQALTDTVQRQAQQLEQLQVTVWLCCLLTGFDWRTAFSSSSNNSLAQGSASSS